MSRPTILPSDAAVEPFSALLQDASLLPLLYPQCDGGGMVAQEMAIAKQEAVKAGFESGQQEGHAQGFQTGLHEAEQLAAAERAKQAEAFRASLIDMRQQWDPLESTCRHASLSIL